jgi:molybdopterin synthase catalytic subunit/molybdopterin synthase sulfur carrier subunit
MAAVVKVLAFAGARDVIGATEVDLELAEAPCSTERFMDTLCERYPGLVPYRRILRVAVNGEYVDAGGGVADGDEVALIPPVAGG